MNAQESMDVNTLLRWMLRIIDQRDIREREAFEAAARLADRATATLRSGLDGQAVDRAWRKERFRLARPKGLPIPKRFP